MMSVCRVEIDIVDIVWLGYIRKCNCKQQLANILVPIP